MPVTVGSDRKLAASYSVKNSFRPPKNGAIALRDDDYHIEATNYAVSRSSATTNFTSTISQHTQLIQRPSYDLYYKSSGQETMFFRRLRTQASDSIEDWRDAHLSTEMAKHNMKFSPEMQRHGARAQFEMLHMYQEMARVRKWRAEADLKEHRETARNLKRQHKMDEEEKKSYNRIQKLKADREMRRNRSAAVVMRGGTARLL